jgi:uncharacterized protein DUF3185
VAGKLKSLITSATPALKYIGVGFVVLGVFLVISGIIESHSLSSRISIFFTGSPSDRVAKQLTSGVVAVAIGASMLFFLRSRQRTPH